MGRLRGAGQRSSSSGGVSKLAGGGGGATGYGDADVAKLKDAIQTLCQSTHPLGECVFPPFSGEGIAGYYCCPRLSFLKEARGVSTLLIKLPIVFAVGRPTNCRGGGWQGTVHPWPCALVVIRHTSLQPDGLVVGVPNRPRLTIQRACMSRESAIAVPI